jgi:hypothetical protein
MTIRGFIVINMLVFGVIAALLTTAFAQWGAGVLKASHSLVDREQAFQVAEAGLEYYRWHLAHAPTDYADGTGSTSTGPFNHDYLDKDGNKIGTFSLTIQKPPLGSTVVTLTSTGTVASTSAKRSIRATLAVPSFAKWAVVANDVMRFGAGTEVFGPIHSNNGIHFDGLAHNIISSAKDKYIDPDFPGPYRFGVYTSVTPTDPSPPAAVPNRSDVFMVGRQFPVATADFAGITVDLSQIKSSAQSGGRYLGPSSAQGYRLLFKINGTFDVYKVNTLISPSNCTNTQNQTNWGTWSIGTSNSSETFVANYANPANGLIFVEDNVWVSGQINNARITVAAGKFPDNASTRRNITVNDNLLYTNYDGRDVIGLIAQNDVNVGLRSADNLRIDGALIAQNGRVGRYYYPATSGNNGCQTANRNSLTLYGTIATNLRYGFAYTDGTGYATRNIIYDNNLLYAPPPSFPLTSSNYSVISWENLER